MSWDDEEAKFRKQKKKNIFQKFISDACIYLSIYLWIYDLEMTANSRCSVAPHAILVSTTHYLRMEQNKLQGTYFFLLYTVSFYFYYYDLKIHEKPSFSCLKTHILCLNSNSEASLFWRCCTPYCTPWTFWKTDTTDFLMPWRAYLSSFNELVSTWDLTQWEMWAPWQTIRSCLHSQTIAFIERAPCLYSQKHGWPWSHQILTWTCLVLP